MNKEYMINIHIQLLSYLSFSFMSNKKTLKLFSRVVLWGNISSQSETGLYNLKMSECSRKAYIKNNSHNRHIQLPNC